METQKMGAAAHRRQRALELVAVDRAFDPNLATRPEDIGHVERHGDKGTAARTGLDCRSERLSGHAQIVS
jgi:hypothetical protein